jgi:hypothetical protein
MKSNWNFNYLELSVNSVQSRATISALVPWRNFFYMLTRVKRKLPPLKIDTASKISFQSLEATKRSLERVVKSAGYYDISTPNVHKDRTSILIEDLNDMRTSGSGSSISLNTENQDQSQQSNRSGAETPSSARSATSLHEVRNIFYFFGNQQFR